MIEWCVQVERGSRPRTWKAQRRETGTTGTPPHRRRTAVLSYANVTVNFEIVQALRAREIKSA